MERRPWGPGPSPDPGARLAGAAEPPTKRLSNFFASVMWIQLSFSTTLMCFTSSLNLATSTASCHRRAPRPRPSGAPLRSQDPPGPRLTPALQPLPFGPPPAPPAPACPPRLVCPSVCPPLLPELQAPSPACTASPSHFLTRVLLTLLSALGTPPPRFPSACEAFTAGAAGPRPVLGPEA